jgi:hypothetical protein
MTRPRRRRLSISVSAIGVCATHTPSAASMAELRTMRQPLFWGLRGGLRVEGWGWGWGHLGTKHTQTQKKHTQPNPTRPNAPRARRTERDRHVAEPRPAALHDEPRHGGADDRPHVRDGLKQRQCDHRLWAAVDERKNRHHGRVACETARERDAERDEAWCRVGGGAGGGCGRQRSRTKDRTDVSSISFPPSTPQTQHTDLPRGSRRPAPGTGP